MFWFLPITKEGLSLLWSKENPYTWGVDPKPPRLPFCNYRRSWILLASFLLDHSQWYSKCCPTSTSVLGAHVFFQGLPIISILSILQRVVWPHCLHFFASNFVLNPMQWGFLPHCFIEVDLIKVTNDHKAFSILNLWAAADRDDASWNNFFQFYDTRF